MKPHTPGLPRMGGMEIIAAPLLVGMLVMVSASCKAPPAGPQTSSSPAAPSVPKKFSAIDTQFFGEEMFFDSVHHYQMSMKPEDRNYPRYKLEQVDKIVENFILLQNQDGGWPKNADWFKIPEGNSDEERIASLIRKPHDHSTLDNRNTWSHLIYLIRAYEQAPSEAIKTSFISGLNYIFASRNPVSKGWRGADVDAMTLNDDVMIGVLFFLQEFVRQDTQLKKDIDNRLVHKADLYYREGIRCLIRSQVYDEDGNPLAWGQQHDHQTLKPVKARAFEPASLSALESALVVRYLMTISQPSTEIRKAIEGAMAWFEKVKISGIRVDVIDAQPIQFPHRFSNKDRVAVKDTNAPPIWARFYELGTNRPIFSNRKSEILSDFNDVPRERREGYNWYGYWPQELIDTYYPQWKAKAR
ncbi:MAG: pectate lyase [Myxococcales bacterium]|nr:pectate lyase [Myxococcales bacterium]